MAKRKKRSRRARTRARKAAANPVIRGQQAFHQGDYDGAIAAWEQARKANPSSKLTAALAEVYFRRGLAHLYRRDQLDPGLSDLDRASRLIPGEPRYAYHLGLTHHRQGNLGKAITAYRRALNADPTFTRAADLAVLALLEQGKNPTQDAAWKVLSPDRQAELKPLVDLVRGRPFQDDAAPSKEKTTSSAAARLWYGLLAIQAGDDRGRNTLEDIVQKPDQPRPVRAVAAYALGLDALGQDRQPEALAHWQAARRLGLDTPSFHDNLGPLYHTCAQQAIASERWAEAASLADDALALLGPQRDLKTLAVAAHLHAGHADALAARWSQALEHWEKAQESGENSRALAQNLALAYEKVGRYPEAADLWRKVVRRRPRKASAPDALTPQQVALLWGHVAECYNRAGNVEEAINTLRNAVKNDPDNVDLRLELADTLAADERWDAAGNEVGRILDRDADNLGALVRAARIDEGDGYFARARQIWKKVLKVDPNHLEAHERLAELLIREGNRLTWLEKFDQALESYHEAVEYTPDEPYLYLSCADCYFRKDDAEAARQELERAFAQEPLDLHLYHSAVDLCHKADYPDAAEWVISRAGELAGPHQPNGRLPADFYLDLARCCFKRDQSEEGDDYVRRAEQIAEGDPDDLVHVALFYLDQDDEGRAVTYLDRALRLDPEHGPANLHMGCSYAAAVEMREANRHWRQARRTARRSGDQELLAAVESARQHFERLFDRIERGLPPRDAFGGSSFDTFGGPSLDMFEEILEGLPPELLEFLLDGIDDEYR